MFNFYKKAALGLESPQWVLDNLNLLIELRNTLNGVNFTTYQKAKLSSGILLIFGCYSVYSVYFIYSRRTFELHHNKYNMKNIISGSSTYQIILHSTVFIFAIILILKQISLLYMIKFNA